MTEAEFLNIVSKAITVASRRSDYAWGHLPLARRIILEAAELIFDPLLEDDDGKQLRATESTFAALSDYFYSVSEALREFREG